MGRRVNAKIAGAGYRRRTCLLYTSLTKIIVEGVGMQTHHGVAAQLFSVLAENKINIMFVTTSATKITFCVYAADGGRAVQGIADSFHLHVR